MTKNDFERQVFATIAANPDWVDAAIRGITRGQAAALEAARQSAGEARNAMALALILANKRGKLTDHMMGLIEGQIVQLIGNPTCGAEHEFIEQHGADAA